MAETLIKKTDDQGYIIAWKHKQNHTDLGKFDKVMTYGEALKECEKLIEENQEIILALKLQLKFVSIRIFSTQKIITNNI